MPRREERQDSSKPPELNHNYLSNTCCSTFQPQKTRTRVIFHRTGRSFSRAEELNTTALGELMKADTEHDAVLTFNELIFI